MNSNQSLDEIMYDLDELTPENIADILFSKMPDDPLTKQLLICQPDENDGCENPGTFVHEILVTILLEGLMKFNDNLNNIDLTNITEEHIQSLAPWFKSLRFNLLVSELDKNLNEDNYKHFYCKIILKKMPEYTLYFTMKNIARGYTFFLNPLYGSNYPVISINNIYSVMFLGNKVFKVQFKCLSENDLYVNNVSSFDKL